MKPTNKPRQPGELLNRICCHLWFAWFDHELTGSQRIAVQQAFADADDLHYALRTEPRPPLMNQHQ